MGSIATAGVINFDASQKTHPVNLLMFGTNFLFWVEDNACLADGSLEKALKNIPCRLLRFPGGTVADNYHWKTNTLHNTAMFPYEEGPEQTDTDEFIAVCRRVGAEPVIVVNTASWYFDNDVQGGAKEAADWVRYCNIEHDYNVKYWEIGNETYWHIAMSAKEYAELVNIYAKAMKAVDPTIKIGANGYRAIDFVGRKDRLKPGTLEELLEQRRKISSRKESAAFGKKMLESCRYPSTIGEEKWWNEVAQICGHNIDIIIVHWYYNVEEVDTIQSTLESIEKLLHKYHPDKEYLMYMSEYNIYKRYAPHQPFDYAMLLLESYRQMFCAGMDMAAFWPTHGDQRALLADDNGPNASAFTMSLLSKNLQGHVVQTQSPPKIPALGSLSSNKADIFISARRVDEPEEITVVVDHFNFDKVNAAEYTGTETPSFEILETDLPVQVTDNHLRFTLRPNSIVHLTLNKE